MKRVLFTVLGLMFLAAQPVAAADIPVKAPAAQTVVATAYNWSGSYFGGHLGYGWARTHINDVDNYSFSSACPPVCEFEFGSNGLIGGVQAGYNWQSGTFVYGAELDFSLSGINNAVTNPLCCAGTESFATDVNWFGTGRVRFGVTLDRALAYLTGGVAVADFESRYNDPPSSNFAVASGIKWGWTAGAGLEFAGSTNWTWRVEYLYIDLRTARGSFDDNRFDFDNRIHVARLALNYRFATGKYPVAPVVTKY
jgi:outer membrane immunogenic protein